MRASPEDKSHWAELSREHSAASAALYAFGIGAALAGAAPVAIAAWGASVAEMAVAAKYAELANDPPRADYHEISLFEPAPLDLPPARSPLEHDLQHQLRTTLDLRQASSCLLLGLERSQGIEHEMITGRGDLGSLWEVQNQAIRHNLKASIALAKSLLSRASSLNVNAFLFLRNAPKASDRNNEAVVREILKSHVADAVHQYRLDRIGIHDAASFQDKLPKTILPNGGPLLLGQRWLSAVEVGITAEEKFLNRVQS
ncbi:MAG TPA: hypothetical protein VFB27_15545 [Opitutaceae bacterium]|nr:hypothetical protein [Opitutaceae bacterium]